MTDFSPNAALDASIEAKIEAAVKRGVNFNVDPAKEGEYEALMGSIGLTAEEQRYSAEQAIYKTAQVVFGEKFFAAIKAGMAGTAFDPADIIPCLTAYFEAGDNLMAGE